MASRRASNGAILVVAVEYAGRELPPRAGGARRPLIEHVYDARGERFPAHPDERLRVGFPDPLRGWPSAACSARCKCCSFLVTELVSDLIDAALYVAIEADRDPKGPRALTAMVWLYPQAQA